jgi:hypothetical protein
MEAQRVFAQIVHHKIETPTKSRDIWLRFVNLPRHSVTLSGFVFAISAFDNVPFEVLRAALRTTARDARSGFVFSFYVYLAGASE